MPPPSLGNAYFAAHVADFTVNGSNVQSHFIGVQSTTAVPAAPGIVFAVSGLLAFGLAELRRFRRARGR